MRCSAFLAACCLLRWLVRAPSQLRLLQGTCPFRGLHRQVQSSSGGLPSWATPCFSFPEWQGRRCVCSCAADPAYGRTCFLGGLRGWALESHPARPRRLELQSPPSPFGRRSPLPCGSWQLQRVRPTAQRSELEED